MTQNLQALHVATEVRLATAARRRRVAAGTDTAAGMEQLALELGYSSGWPKRLTVAQTLHWPYYSMPWHRQAILRHAGLSETRTIQTLTSREVEVLCHALRSPALWKGQKPVDCKNESAPATRERPGARHGGISSMPDEGYIEVQVGGPRTKRQGVALVDHADAEAVGAYSWFMDSKGYAARKAPRVAGGQLTVLMHRSLLDLVPGDPRHTDHINGNRLDNRRANLRVCTNAQNHQNLHERPHRGAYWHARRNRWVAHAKLAGKEHHLGYFDTQAEAAAVASAFRREHMPFSADARLCRP